MTNKTAFLRDYQKDIVARVKEAWELHRSVMVQMPTGTGKTHVLASIVADFPGKVLIVAHRVELVEQIRETILKFAVRAWNWERMFRGMQTGKGVQYSLQPREMACVREAVDVDEGMELLVSHETLLSKLFELSEETERKEIKGTLRAWQDGETGLWGLKKGRTVTVEADYVRVFDMQRDWAAVRFGDHSCGVVDATGKVWWKRDACMSMKFLRNRLMLVQEPDGEEKFVDLCNGQVYEWKPEVKRFGVFELLNAASVLQPDQGRVCKRQGL